MLPLPVLAKLEGIPSYITEVGRVVPQ